MNDRELDVLSFGEALVDFFPPRPGIPLVDCDVFHRHLGGAPANVAVGAARLGLRAGLMTLVGPDDFGQFVRKQLGAEGVDVRGVGVHPTAKTGITFVSVGENGARSFLFFRHPSADQMIAPGDLDAGLIRRTRLLHVGSSTLAREPSRSATLQAVAIAKTAGCLISSDPNWRGHLWDDPGEARPMLQALLAKCDVVKVSDDELEPIIGTSDVERGARAILALGCQLVVITLGERGAYFDSPAGGGYVPGEPTRVVDSTGAGDAFMAGLLSELLPRLPDRAALRLLSRDVVAAACVEANRCGAKAVTALGATTARLA